MSSCCHQTNCNVPTCKFFPEFKKSLEGLAWCRIIQTLIQMKHLNSKEYIKILRTIDIFKNKNDVKFYITLLGFFKRQVCLCDGAYSFWNSCYDSQCKRPHKEINDQYDEQVFVTITVSELINIIHENRIHGIRFGISNVFERSLKYSLHDTRCPEHYNVQVLSHNKNYLSGLGKYTHNYYCIYSHLNI